MNSKSTSISEIWLTLFDIHCIITVTYCKFAVHLLYRATVSHCTHPTSILPQFMPLYGVLTSTVPHYTERLYSTGQHCTYPLTSIDRNLWDCMGYWPALYPTLHQYKGYWPTLWYGYPLYLCVLSDIMFNQWFEYLFLAKFIFETKNIKKI